MPELAAAGAGASRRAPAAWTRDAWLVLAVGLAVGILVRAILLPSQGVRGDLDQFAGWVHIIATQGIGSLYEPNDAGPVTFGPVMAYIWGLLAAIAPGFATATDAADTGLRALLKTPASIADLGLAALAAFALRDRPRWAVLVAVVILVLPPAIYISAWWGQYESIYVLSALAGLLLAIRGHNLAAAALVAVSLMTKPQAVAFIVPFAAWFWATGYRRAGIRGGAVELAKTGLVGLAVVVTLWLPFLPAGGPADYLANLGYYQNEVFNILSVRAWNAWWLVQEGAAGGEFIADDVAFFGPLTMRHVGYGATALLQMSIAWAVVRDPRPRTLVLAVAASVLTVFTFMTQMHERYAYAALITLALLVPDTRLRWLWVAFVAVFSLNLVAAIPPSAEGAPLIPIDGPLGVIGSIAIIVITATVFVWLGRNGTAARPASASSETAPP